MVSDVELKAFGAHARHERERQQYTLQSVATMLAEHGVVATYQAVGSWERGEVEPAREKVFALEKVLRLKAGTLSANLGYGPVDGPARRDIPAALTGKLAELSPDDLAAIEAMVDRLLDRDEP